MRKQLLALSAVALLVAACSEEASNPMQPLNSTQAVALSGRTKIMPMRGGLPFGGVGTQATGILYHGGPIIPSTKVAVMYWGTAPIYTGGPTPGTTGTGAGDGSLVGHFLRNLGGSPYFNINSTYTDNVGGGHTVANSVTYTQFWANNQNVPPSNGSAVSNATIQAEIIRGFNTGAWTYDPQTIYAVFTAGNTNLGGGFGIQYCAYHGAFNNGANVVKYAAQPFVGVVLNGCSNSTPAPNGDAAADAVVNVLAHEVEEAATDPELNAWFDASGQENADKCAWTFGATYNNGTGLANMNLGGKDFLIQQNWVNSGNGGCLLAFGGGSNQPPVASFTNSCTGLTCTFTSTSTDPDGTIASSVWTVGANTVSSSPSFTKTFPAAKTFTLTLTVTDNNGASASTSKVITVSGGTNQPPVASFTQSCNASHACTFTSTSTDPDGTIASQAWKVGANTVSTAASFSKTFPGAKTFTLSLTVTDNGGATNTTSQTVNVP